VKPKAPARDEPPVGQVIAPGTTPVPVLDLAATARKRASSTPTDRIEARADLHIMELKADKESLLLELRTVRHTEMPHLREDMRWLESRESSLQISLTALLASYEWAVSFNWFSFALVGIGGGFVSYASFLPAPQSPAEMDTRTTVATLAVAALLIGVIVQAVTSYRGTKTLMGLAKNTQPPPRPSPNPKPPDSRPD
jgi:hypothetical protein